MTKFHFLGVLNEHASNIPKKIAFTEIDKTGEKQTIDFFSLRELVGRFANGLADVKISAKPVILAHQSSVDFLISFLGVINAGGIPVPCCQSSRKNWRLRSKPIIDDCNPSLFIGSREIIKSIGDTIRQETHLQMKIHEDILDQSGHWEGELNTQKIQDIAYLQYSSGSTGKPKGVMVTHENVLHNINAMTRDFEMVNNSSMVTWLPYFHDMGLMATLMMPLYVGCRSIVMSPMQFVRSPYLWLYSISKYKATHSIAPNFAFDYCVKKIKAHQKEKLDLSSLKCLINGAEPININTLITFADKFASCNFHRNAFYPAYGLAEATLYVSGSKIGEQIPSIKCDSKGLKEGKVVSCNSDNITLVRCGKAIANHCLIIVDPATLELKPENEVGEILFCGPSVTKGYWKNKEATNLTYSIKIPGNDEDHYLRTGDLGFLRDGFLYVCGRIKDLIIIRGENYYPHDIERVVGSVDTLIESQKTVAVAVENNNEQTLAIVQEITNRVSVTNLKKIALSMVAKASETYEIAISYIYFIRKGKILYTTSGKVRRFATIEDIEKNKLDIIYEYRNNFNADSEKSLDLQILRKAITDNSLPLETRKKRLLEFVRHITNLRIIDGSDLSLLETGLDSMTTAKLQTEILKHLKLDISLQQLMEINVDDLICRIIHDVSITKLQGSKRREKKYSKVVTV